MKRPSTTSSSSELKPRHSYVDNPQFHKCDAEQYYGVIGSTSFKAYGDAVKLTREQEVELFLKYNYCKFRASRADGRRVEWLTKANHFGDIIIHHNGPLVTSFAGRFIKDKSSQFYDDYLSEAKLGLFKAMVGFDCARGYKFSTYAVRSIKNALLQVNRKVVARTYKDAGMTGLIYNQWDFLFDNKVLYTAPECGFGSLAQDACDLALGNLLSEIEKTILIHRYGLNGAGALTLKETGVIVKLTNERVRQIQEQALRKLRNKIGVWNKSHDLEHCVQQDALMVMD